MKAVRRSRRRLIFLSTAVMLAVLGGVQAVALRIGWLDARQQLESSAKGVAVSVAHTLSLDPEGYRDFSALSMAVAAEAAAMSMPLDSKEYQEFSGARAAESAYYKKMHFHLKSIKEETGNIKFIATENKLDEKTTAFVLDAEEIGSMEYSPPGSPGVNHSGKDPVFTRGVPTSYSGHAASADLWGKTITGNAPIRAEDGEILGSVGVDIDAKYVWHQFRTTILTLLVADLVIMALFIASVFGFSGTILDSMFMDKLTGAFSKRHFDALLRDGIQRCIKYKHGLALMMMDLDHFKNINDTYGHPFGDRVLANVSKVIRGSIRPEDVFVRYGGEEFALIVASAGAKNVMDVAERLRLAVENRPTFNEERNILVGVTVSIGVARFINLSQTPQELVENADKALYAAKGTRNSVKMHDE
jgi:diguanylate cyclase (GGDEF)-like protein